MVFKINISEKNGKTYKTESEAQNLIGKSMHDKVEGKDILADLEGYELEITGASDKSGFPTMKNVEGVGLKRILLVYGKGMKKRPRREGKIKRSKNKPKGLRLRKTVRGRVISPEIVQINLKVIKEGGKKLEKVFPEQCKSKETKEPSTQEQSQEKLQEQTKEVQKEGKNN